VAKPRGNADSAIVPRHRMGADQRAKQGEERLGAKAADRIGSDDHARVGVEVCTQLRQSHPVEMMKKEVRDDDREVPPFGKSEHIGFEPGRIAGPVIGSTAQIKAGESWSDVTQGAAEFAVAGTDFQDGLAGLVPMAQCVSEPIAAAQQ